MGQALTDITLSILWTRHLLSTPQLDKIEVIGKRVSDIDTDVYIHYEGSMFK